jgi:hypothetical protein
MTDMTMSFHDRPLQDRHHQGRPARSQRIVTPQRRKTPGGLIAGLKRRLRVRPWSTTAYGAFLAVGAAALVNAAFLQQPSQNRGFLGQNAAPVIAQPPAPPARPADLAQALSAQNASQNLAQAPPAARSNPGGAPPVPPQTVAALPRQPAPTASAQRETPRDTAGRDGPGRDPIGDLIRTGQVPSSASGDPVTRGDVPRPPGGVPGGVSGSVSGGAPETRIIAAQRALNRIGVGPVKADGRFGEETRAAIERFERERRLPVTRELTPRTLRELAAVSGTRIE